MPSTELRLRFLEARLVDAFKEIDRIDDIVIKLINEKKEIK